MGMIIALLVLFSISVGSCNGESCIVAQYGSNTSRIRHDCSFSVSDVPAADTCDTTLRQVFRLLDVNDEYVLIGSTECLYALNTTDLEHIASFRIPQPASSLCDTLDHGENRPEFICNNYISNWFDDISDPTSSSFRVCGTYDAMNPRCWNCNKTTGLSCDSGTATDLMPTDPIENVTAIMTEDGTTFFIGGRQEPQTSVDFQIGRVDVNSGRENLVTPEGEQVMYSPQDFVGEPIEHGNFIYFFFRERALENYLQPIIYSRVARVCKNDTGGDTNPLRGMFTTYLKARLMCSCGDDIPMIYNEIQDIDIVRQGSDTFIYGLFTVPSSKMSPTSAICRYSLTEIERLFNNDNRRGPCCEIAPPSDPPIPDNTQIDDTKTWSERPKFPGDSADTRETCGKYTYSADLYNHILNFPLLNTNVPNRGWMGSNNDQMSGDALAVFPNIRGQQLTVSEYSEDVSSGESVKVYIGTNVRQVFEVYMTETAANITQEITLTTNEMSADDINDKWPYGISSLRIHDGVVYGNTDNCAFKFPPYICPSITGLVSERRESNYLSSHTQMIPDAVTNFFTIFDAPSGSNMVPHFSGLFNDRICSWKRFEPDKKEVLHVLCEISSTHIMNTEGDVCQDQGPNPTLTLTGMITIVSGELCMAPDNQPEFEVHIDIDCTEIADISVENEPEDVVKEHDTEMAKYRYTVSEWYKNVSSETCPSAAGCCYP